MEKLLLATYGVPDGLPANSLFFFTSDNGPSLRNEVRGGNAGLVINEFNVFITFLHLYTNQIH